MMSTILYTSQLKILLVPSSTGCRVDSRRARDGTSRVDAPDVLQYRSYCQLDVQWGPLRKQSLALVVGVAKRWAYTPQAIDGDRV